jgi:hypothetical protein
MVDGAKIIVDEDAMIRICAGLNVQGVSFTVEHEYFNVFGINGQAQDSDDHTNLYIITLH